MEENKKANDWMWQSHRETPLMIVKRPQTKDKKMLYLHFQQNIFSHHILATPHQSHPQSMINLNTMITCDWPPSHY